MEILYKLASVSNHIYSLPLDLATDLTMEIASGVKSMLVLVKRLWSVSIDSTKVGC